MTLTNTLLPMLSTEFLTRISNGMEAKRIDIAVKDGGLSCSLQ